MALERHILVVDDSAAMQRSLSLLLRGEGYRVTAATDGQEALSYLETDDRPCLVILDLCMDGMDGWRFLHERRRRPHLANLPVVVLSGFADEVQADVVSGATKLLVKPVDFDELLKVVRQFC